jgi:CSLREA domain-containing protein
MNVTRVGKLARYLMVAWFVIGLLLAQFGPTVPVARAASLTVNSLADGAPANDGACTLREAIINANHNDQSGSTDCAAGSGEDTITFTVSGTITLVSPLPDIADPATLTIDGSGQTVTVSGNSLHGVMVVDDGAALAVQNLTIIDGLVPNIGGGANGGGIWNFGTLTITNSTFSGNQTYFGGAIDNIGTLDITDSTFSGNSALFGGAIENDGTLDVTNSTFSGNSSTYGGAIENDGTLKVTNSTFSGNSAVSSDTTTYGGAIDNFGTLEVSYSTFSGNSADDGGAVYNYSSYTATLSNTLLANSTGGNCSGSILDGGYNLDDETSCGFNTANNSKSGTDPQLDPAGLQDNGGSTNTIALIAGSPAIDAIPIGAGGCGTVITTDQRGIIRPQGSGCDIGAYEVSVYSFTGFFPPIGNPPVVNQVKAGQGVPINFSLGGDYGLDIFEAGYPKLTFTVCGSGGDVEPVDETETVNAGQSSLSYDPETDQYTYIWKTDKQWANKCGTLWLKFDDGSQAYANFNFK